MNQLNIVREQRQHHAAKIRVKLDANIANILKTYPVEMAYLYGSVARGCPLPSSDVDIALLLDQTPPPYERLLLELKVQAAIEDGCGLSNVDVRTINHAPLTVQGHIVQEGLLIYCRNKARCATFESLILRKYFDYRPMAEQMQQVFLEHIRREGLLGGKSKNRYLNSK